MPYELLKISPYSSNGNTGWEDGNNVGEFSAPRRSLRRQFARELEKFGVDISGGTYKFECYGQNNEHMELLEATTDLPL